MNNKLNALQEFRLKIAAFWHARNEKEKNVISIGAGIFVLLLVYLTLFAPALSGRAQLYKDLPNLRLEAAEMQVLSKQATDMSAKAAVTLPTMSSESIGSLLVKRGMRPQNITVTGDFAKVQLVDVPFAGVMSWLDEIQKTSRISVSEANIVLQTTAGSVNATLTLRQQKSELK